MIIKLLIEKDTGKTSEFAVSNLIKWSSQPLVSCSAKTVQICSDAKCTILSSSNSVWLGSNPTKIDSAGNMNPILYVDQSKPINENFFIQGSNKLATVQPMADSVKLKVIICGLEKLHLKEPTNEVFNIHEIKSATQPGIEYDLKGIWELETPGEG